LLKRNVIANYLGQGWPALMGLAFIPLYIRYLGVEAWGLVGFMSMMQAWLTLLDMGLTPTLSREMARFKADVHSSRQTNEGRLLLQLSFLPSGLRVSWRGFEPRA
jgi:O-antigen/teichoic acid export membrane protein